MTDASNINNIVATDEIKAGKRGALSLTEMQFIKDNCTKMDVTNLASHINKSVKTVRKYAYKENLPIKEKGQDRDPRYFKLRRLLRSREYWKDIQQQFSPEELKIFENTWVKLYMQFNEDVWPTEEWQMNKHITLIILKNRYLKKMYSIEKQIDDTQRLLTEEYAKPKGDKDIGAVRDLTTLIDKLQNNQMMMNKEVKSILDSQKDTEKQLKISRDQRIRGIQDSTQNWTGILRILNDDIDIRNLVGKHIEIMRVAQEKEKLKLYDYHTFIDNSVDRLILNDKSVDFYIDEEKRKANE